MEAEGVCSEEKLPSVSSINRIVRSNKRYDGNDSDDDGTGEADNGDYDNSDETSMGSAGPELVVSTRSSRSPAKKSNPSKTRTSHLDYQQQSASSKMRSKSMNSSMILYFFVPESSFLLKAISYSRFFI